MSRCRKLLCALIASSLIVSGCATQAYVPASDADIHQMKVKAGDQLRVVTTQRERLSFNVIEVRSDRVMGITLPPSPKEHRPAGETVEVLFDELAVVELTPTDAGHVGPRILAVLLVVQAVGAILLMTLPIPPAAAFAGP